MSDKRPSRQSNILGGQLVRRVMLLSLIAILGLGAAVAVSLGSTLQFAQRRLDEAGSASAEAFDDFLGVIEEDLRVAGALVPLTEDLNALLRSSLKHYPAISEMILVEPDGQVMAQRRRDGEADQTLPQQPWLETVRAGETYIGSVSYEAEVPLVDIGVPVENEEGDFEATLLARVDLTDLWDTVIESEVGETGYVYIVDEAGQILAHHDLQLVREGAMMTDLTGLTPQEVAQAGFDAYSGVSGDRVLASSVSLDVVPWYVVVEQPLGEALRTFTIVAGGALALLLTVGLLVYTIIRFTRHRIVSPLNTLREGVELLREGELEHRIALKAEDELGALADAFNTLAARLQEVIGTLEQRVAERTQEMQESLFQLEGAAQVARQAAAIRDVDQLMEETVHLISVLFGFYHVAIFLLDEAEEYAVLQTASSQGGREMLERGHRLRVGEEGIVGQVASSGTSHVALDVGEDAVHFANPDLPDTRSEMVVPLEIRGEVIGVLDVQSVEEAAFSDQDVAIIKTLADQIALAIENARLLEESERALRELETFYGREAREAWEARTAHRRTAYRYTGTGVEPVSLSALSALEESEGDDRRLEAPIHLRGERIGSIVLRQDGDASSWSSEDLALVEEVSDQIALALENARLLEETQRRAVRERLVSETTARMRESLNVDAVLQAAVREMREMFGLEEAEVRLMRLEEAGER